MTAQGPEEVPNDTRGRRDTPQYFSTTAELRRGSSDQKLGYVLSVPDCSPSPPTRMI